MKVIAIIAPVFMALSVPLLAALTQGKIVTDAGIDKAATPAKTNVKPGKTWKIDPSWKAAAAINAILGPGATDTWEFSGGDSKTRENIFSIDRDAALRIDVLAVAGARQVNLFQTDGTDWTGKEVRFKLRLGRGPGGKSGSATISVAGNPDEAFGRGNAVILSGARNGTAMISALGVKQLYDLKAYDTIMPTWPDMVRIPVEHDMAMLPDLEDKWFDIRFKFGAQSCEIWIDDRFVVRKSVPDVAVKGNISIALSDGSRLAPIDIQSLSVAADDYEPLRLDGFVHDRLLVDDQPLADGALPAGGSMIIGGVPFLFAARKNSNDNDHVDVGRSLVRQGNLEGHLQMNSVRGGNAFVIDPARIQLRVPFDYYDALYVIAGFDGEKDNIPLLSTSFSRAGAGFHQIFECDVPPLNASRADGAIPVPVALADGRKIKLWMVKIPFDPALLASFSDLESIELELSKKMYLYRGYPDPIGYGWHQGGLPSGVHLYALTLHRAPVTMKVEPKVFGHVWTAPAKPGYAVELKNRGATAAVATVFAATTSYDGSEKTIQETKLKIMAGGSAAAEFEFSLEKNGIHRLDVTSLCDGQQWTETRHLARLAKDTRSQVWQPGDGPLFGYWSYHGGHHTPPAEEIMRLMRLAGARGVTHAPRYGEAKKLYDDWQWREGGNAHVVNNPQDWAATWPIDPSNKLAYLAKCEKQIRERQGDSPEFISFFTEPTTTRDITAGSPPDYWGDPGWNMTDVDRRRVAMFRNAATIAAEMVREKFPSSKILIPWGDPLFVVALLRTGFQAHLVDGVGLDMIGFERLPEQQIHQMSTHRLYILKEEFKKVGIPDPALVYVEGIFAPTEPGALTWDEQAERYHRWALISLAYGVTRFHAGWFAFDCGNYYGAEHYGGCGIQRRIPYCDPKPAYANFATMTRQLNGVKFGSWLETGSHNLFCLKFIRRDSTPVYAMWTARGKRTVDLELEKGGVLTVTDSMDNDCEMKAVDGKVAMAAGTSPVYLNGVRIAKIAAGKPDYSDAVDSARLREQQTFHTGPAKLVPPVAAERRVADLGDGSWIISDDRDEIYENNNFDTRRFRGRMTAAVTNDHERPGAYLAIHLEKQTIERKLMPLYSILKPAVPTVIPGRSVALGVWAKANSDWGRVVYKLRDAKGERWLSCGTKDQWNCNDPHGWSMFNYDGWRYLRFELPGNAPYDCYRQAGTTWWGHYGGDGIVDLPLRIESVIVERRTHVVYVNDIQPANTGDVLLGEIVAEYAVPGDMDESACAQSRLRMTIPQGDFGLKNPIVEMAAAADALPPVKLGNISLPDWDNDGTKCFVHFAEVVGADQYQVWIASYPDGRGAMPLATMKKSGGQIRGLRPGMKLYLWVTYTAGGERMQKESLPGRTVFSKPSNRFDVELVDAFGMK